MLTSSSCRTRVCCARSVLCCWRAGRSLVGGVRLSLGPSLNLWALPCLPRAAVWSCACSVVLRDAGPPLARRGCRVMGWWLSAPPLPQWRGRGFPCASHLCGVGLRTEVGGGFIGGGRRIRTCSFSVMGAVCFRYTSPRCARVVTLLGVGGPGLLRSSPGACLAGARRGARRFPGRGVMCAAWLRWGQSAPHTCRARYLVVAPALTGRGVRGAFWLHQRVPPIE